MNKNPQGWEKTYRCLADLWLSPQDVDTGQIKKEAGEVAEALKNLDGECADLLRHFLEGPTLSEEAYVDCFELSPQCSLYLGSHAYEEPKTCAGAGVSDRNDYMIELLGIFKHFGWSPVGGELPDYLPSLLEFLALTASSREDPVRKKLVHEYILPFLPPIRTKLEGLKTHYVHLLNACERILNVEEEGIAHGT